MVVGSGLCVVMALMIAVSVEPTYMTRLARPGAMPIAWVISRFCSLSSQEGRCSLCWYHPSRASVIGDVVCLTDILEVGSQISQICSVVFQQARGSGRRRSEPFRRSRRRACRCPETTPKGRSRWWHGRRRLRASMPWALAKSSLLDEQRVGDGVVVQARDMPEIEWQVERRLAVGRIEIAILGGVLVGAHVHVERRFDGGHSALDLHISCRRANLRRPQTHRSSRTEPPHRSLPGRDQTGR